MSADQSDSRLAASSRQSKEWRHISGALWFLCVGLGLIAISSLAIDVLMTHLLERLRTVEHGAVIDIDAVFDTMNLYEQVFLAVTLGATITMLIGLLQMSRVPVASGARVFALVAGGAFSVVMAWVLLRAVSMFASDSASLREFVWNTDIRVLTRVMTGITMACLLVVLVRMSTTLGATLKGGLVPLAWVWIVWDTGFALFELLAEPAFEMRTDAPWTFFALIGGVRFVGTVLMVIIAARTLWALDGRGPIFEMHGGGGVTSAEWQNAASGLELYGSALGWRVFITFGTYVFLLVIGRSAEGHDMAKIFLVIAPAVAMITTGIMLAGLVRYTRQPMNSPAAATAWLASVLMGIGLLFDGYGLVFTFKLFSLMDSTYPSYREMTEMSEQMRSMSMWAMGLGFGSLLALLVSFGQVTSLFRRLDLRDRVVGVGIFIGITSVLVLGFRSYMADGPSVRADALMVYALMVLMLTLVALVTYINLVHTVVRSMREYDDGDLPPATVVESAR